MKIHKCESCRIRKAIIKYVKKHQPICLELRKMGKILSLKHPQQVKHHVQMAIREGDITATAKCLHHKTLEIKRSHNHPTR